MQVNAVRRLLRGSTLWERSSAGAGALALVFLAIGASRPGVRWTSGWLLATYALGTVAVVLAVVGMVRESPGSPRTSTVRLADGSQLLELDDVESTADHVVDAERDALVGRVRRVRHRPGSGRA